MSLLDAVFPLAALLALVAAGSGPAGLLAGRFTPDAAAALAAPLAAAVLMCASPLLHLGAPIRAVGAGTLLTLTAVGVARFRLTLRVLAAGAVPTLVAVLVLALVSIPAFARGSWGAASYGNADPYLWVSQARSFLDGPPPQPASRFPDREAFDLIQELHWPVGLPFGVGLVSSVAGDDPADRYLAFVAIVSTLLAMAAYFSARACFSWSRGASALVSLLVGTNAYLVFAAYYGWQGQLAITAFGTLAVVCFRLALETSRLREQLLTATFAGAALATYGPPFAPFAALMLCAAIAYGIAHGERRAWPRVGAVSAGVAALTVVVAGEPVVRAARYLGTFVGFLDVDWLGLTHPRGLPHESLGLVPRLGDLARVSTGWSALALVVACLLVALGFAGTIRRRPPRFDLLIACGGASFVAVALLQVPLFSPYLSIKVAAYSAPLLTMFVVGGLMQFPRSRLRASATAAAVSLFTASTVVALLAGVFGLRGRGSLPELDRVGGGLAGDASVEIAVEDAWRQSWAIYYLRDRPMVVRHPTVYLTAFGQRAYEPSVEGPPGYVLRLGIGERSLWSGHGVVLVREEASRRAAG